MNRNDPSWQYRVQFKLAVLTLTLTLTLVFRRYARGQDLPEGRRVLPDKAEQREPSRSLRASHTAVLMQPPVFVAPPSLPFFLTSCHLIIQALQHPHTVLLSPQDPKPSAASNYPTTLPPFNPLPRHQPYFEFPLHKSSSHIPLSSP